MKRQQMKGKHLALNQSYKSEKNGFVLWLSPLTAAMCEDLQKGGSIRTKAAYIAGRSVIIEKKHNCPLG